MEQMNWDDVRLFLAVAERGSFRRAAMNLDVGHSTLSRRIESLEASLGAQLFNRQSTGLTLTAAGEDLQRTGLPIQQEFAELKLRMFGQDEQPRGNIRFTAPSLFLSHLLLEPLHDFCLQWPDIHIEIDHSLDLLNLASKEADIALRMTNNPGDQLIGRKIGVFCEAVYASPAYLDWFRDHQPTAHRWLSPGDSYRFNATLQPDFATAEPPQPFMTVPDMEAQARGAEMGIGVATLPCLLGDARPALVRISEVFKRFDIWLLSHRDSRANKRMQLFRDFLVQAFTAQQHRLYGEHEPV
ncbi:MAG: LysR family transcriptional regulator [Pseudomonadota bacterium]